MRSLVPILASLLLTIAGFTALAQRAATPSTQQTTRPATAPATFTVVEVFGSVQFRRTDTDPWERLVPGTVLSPTAFLRTGPRSRVLLRPDVGSDVTVSRLGTATVAEVVRNPTSSGVRYTLEGGEIVTPKTLYPGSTRPAIHPFPRTRPVTTRPAARTADDVDDVLELALRSFLKERAHKTHGGYVSIGHGPSRTDPSDAFLSRFADLGLPLRKQSERPQPPPAKTLHEAFDQMLQVHSPHPPIFSVTLEDWLSDTEAVVRLDDFVAPLNGYGYRVIVYRKDNAWHLTRWINGTLNSWRS